MAAGYREVERKYDVGEGFELPTVSDLLPVPDGESAYDAGSPRTVALDATYFDTADHRLLHAGLTLRRRTGGADAGWHLKVPTEDGERLEIHAPLGRSERTVPLRLRRLVWIRTRDAALVPVLRLQTSRTESTVSRDGAALALIADDRVTAERLTDGEAAAEVQTWREIEVELVEGDKKLLKRVDRALRAAGAARSPSRSKLARGLGQERPARPQDGVPALATNASAAEVVVAYLAAERDHLADQDLAVRLDRPDSIHQMRVATRRLRSTLRTFAPLFTDGAIASVAPELKWLAEELGAARDAEVLRARLAEDVAEERAHQHTPAAVARRIDREMARAEKEAFAEVVAALDSDRYRRVVAAIDELVAAPPFTERAARPARKELLRPVRRAGRKVERALARVDAMPVGAERSTALHEVRKKAKRARYAGEALTPVYGERAATFAAAMERLQDLLGEHHDSVALQLRLEELIQADEPDTAFTLGRLHAREGLRQTELEVEIASAARAATKRSLRSGLG